MATTIKGGAPAPRTGFTDLKPAIEPARVETPKLEPAAVNKGWGANGANGANAATARAPAEAGPDVSAKMGELKKLLNGHTDRNEEQKIISLFRDASGPELNGMLGQMSMHDIHEMVGDVQDRKFLGIKTGPQNQSQLLNVFSHERLDDLSTESRAKVIHGLQYHATHPNAEHAIRDIFVGTKGEQLTDLKRQVDGGGDYHDLQQLLWHDIDSGKTRDEILGHFKAEAKPTGQVKVLSDIDDTFYCNLKDDRYPKKTVYPGLRELYSELDKGPNAATPDAKGDVTFISARPYDRAGIIEDDMTRKMLEGNNVDATIRSGDLAHVVGNHAIADKKFDNWQQERQMFPEYKRVAFGDSGQGDMYLEAKALQTGNDTSAAFLHNVTHLSDADRAKYAGQGITVFDTYVGAANEAYSRGLISRDGLERVANSAMTELSQIKFDSPEQKSARQADLNRDLTAMRQLLAAP